MENSWLPFHAPLQRWFVMALLFRINRGSQRRNDYGCKNCIRRLCFRENTVWHLHTFRAVAAVFILYDY